MIDEVETSNYKMFVYGTAESSTRSISLIFRNNR